MFCKNCGSQIDDNAYVCPHCGVRTSSVQYAEQKETNILAIVGFILSFFIAIAGLICSILGYKRAPEMNGNGKSLALAGIIISIVSMAIVLIYIIIVAAAVAAVV